jgi:diguanylate cyclase (GGDEF)-like protein
VSFLYVLPQEERQAAQTAARMPSDPEGLEPGFFEGLPGAYSSAVQRVTAVTAKGIIEGESAARRLVDSAFGTNFADSMEVMRERARQNVARTSPDPYTTGTLGNILYGLIGTGLPAAVGAAYGGPGGAALATGGAVGVGTYADLRAQGVDPGTAQQGATLDAILAAGGVFAPAAIGGRVTLSTLVYGPGINVAQDLAATQGIAELLESQGYQELSEHYRQINGEMLVASALLGAGFGYLGARDAAMTAVARKHVELDTAPGIPANHAALQEHVRNLATAEEALLTGQPVRVESRGVYIERPPIEGDTVLSALRESGYPELLGDIRALELELSARGRAVEDEGILPRAERRADAAEIERLKTLRAEWQAGKLDPAGYDELQTLETRDRLSAKVGGRRIQGVQNLEAYVEAEARGELLPVRGFADADNFKAVNDELGHSAGDQAIVTLARVFSEELGEGRVFHRSGDEFLFHARTPEELDAAMSRARARLERAELVGYRPDGATVSRKGLRFSYGKGETVEAAENAQTADKAARKAAGLRTDRAEPTSEPVRSREGMGDEGAAREVGASRPAEIVDETGRAVSADEILAQGDQAVSKARQDSAGFDAAINCFLRNGA